MFVTHSKLCTNRIGLSLRRVATRFPSKTIGPRLLSTLSKPEDIIDQCINLRSSVQQLNDKFKGPLEASSQKNTVLPFVFLLGNHSSGKSSFINYICQRKVQTAGVAPTDDSFTIIVPGPSDVDRDGPSFIGDPDMGFSGLRMFGPQLVHHTQLKVRSNISIKNLMVIDTPGMIDSPRRREHYNTTLRDANIIDRGYDFEAVCRWYAERADVILLFFDPDKPGTTGETLQILTNSLVGLDHKLHIILNKADQFKKIHDFARAYGSLCWNLSKVIHRKDLPRIYTMCLPQSYQSRSSGDREADADGGYEHEDEGAQSLGRGLIDLEATREEVVLEVLNAPKRRVDNEITRLTDSVSLLQMHLTVVDDLTKSYSSTLFRSRLYGSVATVATTVIAAGCMTLGLPLEVVLGLGITGYGTSFGLYYIQSSSINEAANKLITDDNLVSTFRRLYARKIAEKDEYTTSLWPRVHDHLSLALTSGELKQMDKVKSSDLKKLQSLLESDIPNLRRLAAPTFNQRKY